LNPTSTTVSNQRIADTDCIIIIIESIITLITEHRPDTRYPSRPDTPMIPIFGQDGIYTPGATIPFREPDWMEMRLLGPLGLSSRTTDLLSFVSYSILPGQKRPCPRPARLILYFLDIYIWTVIFSWQVWNGIYAMIYGFPGMVQDMGLMVWTAWLGMGQSG
jgi:hypothetical protein